MSVSERIRKIRENRGLKQFTIANEMHITQQAYSQLEKTSGNHNHKVETLKRFCGVVKVEMPFLLACDIPITDENMLVFDTVNYSVVFENYKKLKNKLSTYEEIFLKQQGNSILPIASLS
jgi:transcriptional regulator with XRE-family HTH domain